MTVWFLVGTWGMDYGDYYWGLYRDPFPHSLLSTRQMNAQAFAGQDECLRQRGPEEGCGSAPPGVPRVQGF